MADELGVRIDAVKVLTGDTATVPYGGGAWASRGITLGGEAARRAARSLRENALKIPRPHCCSNRHLRLPSGTAPPSMRLADQISLAEIAAATGIRPHTIPLDEIPPLEVIASYVPNPCRTWW